MHHDPMVAARALPGPRSWDRRSAAACDLPEALRPAGDRPRSPELIK
jgi:hypothetical protein